MRMSCIVADGDGASISYIDNPRAEDSENELNVSNDTILRLGLEPIRLDDGLLREVSEIAGRYAERADRSRIPCVSRWR